MDKFPDIGFGTKAVFDKLCRSEHQIISLYVLSIPVQELLDRFQTAFDIREMAKQIKHLMRTVYYLSEHQLKQHQDYRTDRARLISSESSSLQHH